MRFGKALQSQGQKACLVCRIVRSRRVSSISMASSSARTAEALPRIAERQSFGEAAVIGAKFSTTRDDREGEEFGLQAIHLRLAASTVQLTKVRTVRVSCADARVSLAPSVTA